MKQFVPMTDEMLYQLGGPPGPLVPFRLELPCYRGMQAGLAEARRSVAMQAGDGPVSPESAPAITDELPIRRRA